MVCSTRLYHTEMTVAKGWKGRHSLNGIIKREQWYSSLTLCFNWSSRRRRHRFRRSLQGHLPRLARERALERKEEAKGGGGMTWFRGRTKPGTPPGCIVVSRDKNFEISRDRLQKDRKTKTEATYIWITTTVFRFKHARDNCLFHDGVRFLCIKYPE